MTALTSFSHAVFLFQTKGFSFKTITRFVRYYLFSGVSQFLKIKFQFLMHKSLIKSTQLIFILDNNIFTKDIAFQFLRKHWNNKYFKK